MNFQPTTASIGHNRAPIADLDLLKATHSDLISRAEDLKAAFERAPTTIEDDETAGRVGDFQKQISACIKASEGARVAEKEPVLQAQRTIDGFFKGISDPLETLKNALGKRLTDYLRRKEEQARRVREEEARRAAEEARKAQEAAERAAEKVRGEKTMAKAVTAQSLADQKVADAHEAAAAVAAKPAELSRTRGDHGSLASLRTSWNGDVDNITDATLIALKPYIAKADVEKALRLAIRAGIREVPGCTIYQTKTAAVR